MVCYYLIFYFSQQVTFSFLFFIGAVPIFMSFFIVTILNHLENWDPLWVFVKWIARGLKKCLFCICRKRTTPKLRLVKVLLQALSFEVSLCDITPSHTFNGLAGVEFRFGLRESKLILKFQLLHILMEKLILISGCYENHCENRFSDSRRISSPGLEECDFQHTQIW